MGIQSVPWLRGHGWRRVHAGCSASGFPRSPSARASVRPPTSAPSSLVRSRPGKPVNPVKLAPPLHAARVAAVTGNNKAAEAHIKAVASDITRSARMLDPHRPIDHEAARAAVRPIEGVRTSLWLDRENFVVMVGGQRHRSMAMIDWVCVALEPLGDTLAVVVNVQDVTAKNGDEAKTLSRNWQLAEGRGRSCRGRGKWIWWRRRLGGGSRGCRGAWSKRLSIKKVHSDPSSSPHGFQLGPGSPTVGN